MLDEEYSRYLVRMLRTKFPFHSDMQLMKAFSNDEFRERVSELINGMFPKGDHTEIGNDSPLWEFRDHPRTQNAFYYRDIKKVAELSLLTRAQVSERMKNVGKPTLQRIDDALTRRGLDFASDDEAAARRTIAYYKTVSAIPFRIAFYTTATIMLPFILKFDFGITHLTGLQRISRHDLENATRHYRENETPLLTREQIDEIESIMSRYGIGLRDENAPINSGMIG